MKCFICLLAVVSCALAVPVDQQTSTLTSTPTISNFGAKLQPTASDNNRPSITPQHPAQWTSASSNNGQQTNTRTTDIKTNSQTASKIAQKRDTQSVPVQPASAINPASVTAVKSNTPTSAPVPAKQITKVRRTAQKPATTSTVLQNNSDNKNQAIPISSNQPAKVVPAVQPVKNN
ncbi:mucin-5AC-like [Topomyia yanbarensis]|uniref:mucin-5AC-like n=1 Tax=Topomyia yanbarensis TaxID=2498891 RepID=UPI00273BD0A4|nr:mucin-5AC-like [Topomyia yanbarensis]